ncbi:Glucan endo-1 3-beta-glucosidase [Bienertia sinuspersici]
MRIYGPNQAILQALQDSGIKTILDVPNDQIQSLASDQSATIQWIKSNIVPFASSIKYIAVGNEIHPSTDPQASSVQPAMKNVQNALNANNLGDQIKVSISIDTSLIKNTSPPSNGQFDEKYTSYINPIIDFLTSNGSPLLVNVYPYFS